MPKGKTDGTEAINQAAEPAPKPIHDRRAMEKTMSDIGKLLATQNFKSMEEANAYLQSILKDGGQIPSQAAATPFEEAQDVMYEAWDAEGERRVELAQKALSISPDCADAYVLLAEETAQTPEQAHVLYTKAVAAGERALGPRAFTDDVGHFWGIMETRPYMRARLGLASALWALGKHDAAIAHYQDMLRLNPGDNQGVRYPLMSALLQARRNLDARKLLNRYKGEATAGWLYSEALLAFRHKGNTPQAQEKLLAALQANPFVPIYLLGLRELPAQIPSTIGFGDATEGQAFLAEFGPAWLMSNEAMEWLARTVASERSVVQQIGQAMTSLLTPAEWDERSSAEWREQENEKPISVKVKLQTALNKTPADWIDGMALRLGLSTDGLKRDKVAAITQRLMSKEGLEGAVAGLSEKARAALALTLKDGWVAYGALTEQFGAETGDGWWWVEKEPESVVGRLRLAGLVFVGTASIQGSRTQVAVIPVDLRPLLDEITGKAGG
jgi:tetratricopeptide (TPR) repeat protein